MIEEIKQLLQEKSMCVLATASGGQPHCSLMAYVADEAGTELVLTTLRSTRKFRNIVDNPAVSLLVDTREDLVRDRARALTIEGTCRPVPPGPEREQARARLRSRHPHLASLLDDPESELLQVRVASLLLLKGLTEAYRATVPSGLNRGD
jgi:nitroimidazol reductase NimA-like FMN-containing flavoprotein (pyridoxamine 5'-phosphate oxidase superfamily)